MKKQTYYNYRNENMETQNKFLEWINETWKMDVNINSDCVGNIIEFYIYKFVYKNKDSWPNMEKEILDSLIKNKGLKFDWDCCEKLKNDIKELLSNKYGCENVQWSDRRERELNFSYGNKEFKLETDTINSMYAMMNCFLRAPNKTKKWFEEKWFEMYNQQWMLVETDCGIAFEKKWPKKFSKITDKNRDLWVICNIENIYKYYQREGDKNRIELLNLFNRWAAIAATKGNVMLGPIGFNYRDKKAHANQKLDFKFFRDDKSKPEAIDEFLKKCATEDDFKDWKEEFDSIAKINCMEDYFDEQGRPITIGGEPRESDDFDFEKSRISAICNLIERRNQYWSGK